jgi:1,4-dihydroxy-2-naphthoate octaprenyltransferase
VQKDKLVNKRTLAVLIGDKKTRILLFVVLLKPFFNLIFFMYFFNSSVWPALFALLWLIGPILQVSKGASGKELISILVKTGQAQFLFSLLLLFSLFF